jgi:anti-anti-sigma factor
MISTLLIFGLRPNPDPRGGSSPAVTKDVSQSNPRFPSVSAPTDSERPADVQVTTDQTAEGLVVRVKGIAGVKQVGALESGLMRSLARRPSAVTLDLSNLCSISCLAMGVLMSYRRGLLRVESRVHLAGHLQPAVREALERANLLNVFREAPTGALEQANCVGGCRPTTRAAVPAEA